jgi:TonB family protein
LPIRSEPIEISEAVGDPKSLKEELPRALDEYRPFEELEKGSAEPWKLLTTQHLPVIIANEAAPVVITLAGAKQPAAPAQTLAQPKQLALLKGEPKAVAIATPAAETQQIESARIALAALDVLPGHLIRVNERAEMVTTLTASAHAGSIVQAQDLPQTTSLIHSPLPPMPEKKPAPTRVAPKQVVSAAYLEPNVQMRSRWRAMTLAPVQKPATTTLQKKTITNSYAAAVRAALARSKPKTSQRGSATVSFAIDAQGTLCALRITRSSGIANVDKLALATVRNAGPFPNRGKRTFEMQSYTIRIDFR